MATIYTKAASNLEAVQSTFTAHIDALGPDEHIGRVVHRVRQGQLEPVQPEAAEESEYLTTEEMAAEIIELARLVRTMGGNGPQAKRAEPIYIERDDLSLEEIAKAAVNCKRLI